jgi:hypothetical protein
MGKRPLGALIVVAALTCGGAAIAQNAERGVAQSLFEEGVRLMREKKYAEACPKLAESHRLEPAGGTILDLAICLEQDGKLASAYVAYGEALARAKKDGNKQRTASAESRMAALRPRLSRVTIIVASVQANTKLDVRFDGAQVSEQAWGVAFYADVGVHTITAESAGYKAWKSELNVDAAAKQYEITIPALEADQGPAAAPPPSQPPIEERRTEKPKPIEQATPPQEGRGPLPWILVGTGGALLVAGAVTGALAFSKHSDSNAACPDGRCTSAGVSAEHQANTFAWIANVTIPLGVIAGAAGAYLFLRNPTSRAATILRTGAF